jgi:hypothetical protein
MSLPSEVTPEFDQIAEWLGDMPEAYNVTDYANEQATSIDIDVEALAHRIVERIGTRQFRARVEAALPECTKVGGCASVPAMPRSEWCVTCCVRAAFDEGVLEADHDG